MITGFPARDAPRLPAHRWTATVGQLAAAGLVHVIAATLILLLPHAVSPRSSPEKIAALQPVRLPPRLVFFAPTSLLAGGGGGGGGNRQAGPIRLAHGIGRDAVTLRTRKPETPSEKQSAPAPAAPALLLEARSLASGTTEQIGLPEGGVATGTSTGPGSGGGVGTGIGTGIGPGRGPGLGPGSGGGTGGSVYRPGGAVSAPRLVSQVKPRYTVSALSEKIQGTVWLEVVVTREGRTADIRVVRSLEAGLDEEAVAAVHQWQFEPGRLAGNAVDVVVMVALDFHIR